MTKKIAIPTEGEIVNAHFGRSQAFTVFEIENGQVLNQELMDTRGFEHQHAGIAQLLKSKGTETVICGGIGPGAIQGLESQGLEVLRGASGPVRDVAEAFANGTFIGTEAVCDHSHDHDHHDMHKH
ncbi:NifB/NifX family molybdenum-iron cluster-binding protein [Desulfitobacterium sp. Sab5]|uniref:NifB/NifX family molybdenum-iron cluster-binding protein n=1 Tax=Desulfitobacterium nosdiversum TaxID=3375356 RepID=UPI003CF8245B